MGGRVDQSSVLINLTQITAKVCVCVCSLHSGAVM